jgi:hypothetical protein
MRRIVAHKRNYKNEKNKQSLAGRTESGEEIAIRQSGG